MELRLGGNRHSATNLQLKRSYFISSTKWLLNPGLVDIDRNLRLMGTLVPQTGIICPRRSNTQLLS